MKIKDKGKNGKGSVLKGNQNEGTPKAANECEVSIDKVWETCTKSVRIKIFGSFKIPNLCL